MNRLLIILLLPLLVLAQPDKTSLSELYNRLDTIYPLVKNNALYIEQFKLVKKKIKANYYPKIDLNAQLTYQSEVTSLNFDFPDMFNIEMEDPSKDQYKVTVDVNQMIFDAGRNNSVLEIEKASSEIDKKTNEIELYQLKFQINDIYFAILKLQQTKKVIEVSISQIEEQIKIIESGIENGILTKSTLYELEVERLNLDQKTVEVKHQISAFIDILNVLLKLEINPNTILEHPDSNESQNISRPELQLFELNKTRLLASSQLLKKNRYPVLFAFGQAGYGRPGVNMLSNEFDDFYIVGAKLSWNIWDWNKTKNERQSIQMGMHLIDNKVEVFNLSIESALIKEYSNIEKIKTAIQSDEKIIDLRKKITANSKSQLTNGIIRATDYTTDLNKETIAKINYEIHKIELIQSKINYQTIKGI